LRVSRRAARVLIVEIEPAIALILEDMLKEMGFEQVHIAYDLSTARDSLGEVDLAIVKADPEETVALAFAEKLRSRGVTVVFSTGRTAHEFPEECREIPLIYRPPHRLVLSAALRSLGFD
jgi:DNA-binding response OmpR family regulator